jgi:signal transduction histidine kinase
MSVYPEASQQVSNSLPERVAMSGPGLSAVIRANDLSVVFSNKMFLEYVGCSIKELESFRISGIIEPFFMDRFFSHMKEVEIRPDAGNSFVIYELKNKEGEYKPFYVYASMVEGDIVNAEKLYHLFMMPDQSKWGMPFTSFDTRELFLEQFKAEDFGTFEWIIDLDKIYWSAGLYHIYELDKNLRDLNSEFTIKFIHPHDKDVMMKQVYEAFENGGDLNIEYRVITGRNNLKQVHCLANVIRDEAGKPLKLAGSVRDITGQRTIELNMKDMVDELHRSNRELEEFAYAASHDLQEPLRKITTFSDRLSEKYKNVLIGDGQMYLSRMVASAENMRLLINGLLEFSRISQLSVPFEPVSLDSVLQEVMNELELKIEETGTAIRCSGLPVVAAIAPQMKQLFTNLISNAIKFHREGIPPIIRLEMLEIEEGELQRYNLQPQKRYYKIAITDNGIGFENEYASRIFQVFQRLHGKSEYPGSGIGLAICKKILECHHGVIYAENMNGQGARFIFLMPEHH